jgi:hypothetical protein
MQRDLERAGNYWVLGPRGLEVDVRGVAVGVRHAQRDVR